jgi:hypothetical protein
MINFTQHEINKNGMDLINCFLRNNDISTCYRIRTQKSSYGLCNMVDINIKEQKSLLKVLYNIQDFLIFKKEKAINAIDFLENKMIKSVPASNLKIIDQNKKRYWKQTEIDIMIKMKNEGFSYTAIANELNRSYTGIVKKLQYLNEGITRTVHYRKEAY